MSANYDSEKSCLFLTLHNQGELAALQDSTLAEQELNAAAIQPVWCLMQDNMALVSAEIIDWLVDRILPVLHRAGVRHWAWVCGPTLRSCRLAEQVAKRLPQLKFTVFNDLEHAVTCLQRAK